MYERYQHVRVNSPVRTRRYLIMCIPSRKYASVCVDKCDTRVNATRSGQGGGVLEIHELSREHKGWESKIMRETERRRRERDRENRDRRGDERVHGGLPEFRECQEETQSTRIILPILRTQCMIAVCCSKSSTD